MANKISLDKAIENFVAGLEDSNDDEASQAKNYRQFTKIIDSFADSKVLDAATSKEVVGAFYSLVDLLQSEIPDKYADLMPDSDFSYDDGVFEALDKLIEHEKFPASEVSKVIKLQNESQILELGYTDPTWVMTKVLQRSQYFELWEANFEDTFQRGYHSSMVLNPMTPKQLLLYASEHCLYEVRRNISKNQKADAETIKNVLIRGDYQKPDFKEERLPKSYFDRYEAFMKSDSVIKDNLGLISDENKLIQIFAGEEKILPTNEEIQAAFDSFWQQSNYSSISWEKFYIPLLRDHTKLELTKKGQEIRARITNLARPNGPMKLTPGTWSAPISQVNTAELLFRYWLSADPAMNQLLNWTAQG